MVKKKLQQVTNITNYGINNGIIAGTVIVPPDKDIPLTENYSISQYDTGAVNIYERKNIYEFKPKIGTWTIPFFAWPKNEDIHVRGKLCGKSSSLMLNEDTASITFEGKIYLVNVTRNIGRVSNSSSGSLFAFDNLPSVLFFGDYENLNSQFFITTIPKSE